MSFALLALLCGLAQAADDKNPFVAAEAMLAPIPETPEHIAKSEEALAVWTEMVEQLETHREADHDHKAFCFYKELKAFAHEKAEDIDARSAVRLGKANTCSTHTSVGGEKHGKGSKSTGQRLEGVKHAGATVTVYYGTDRNVVGEGKNRYGGGARCKPSATGGDPSCLELGELVINIPDVHKIGHLEDELPGFWGSDPDPAQDLYMVSLEKLSAADWSAKLKTAVGSTGGSIFVFIHGYNNSFDDAARRAGQMAYDLRFDGVPLIYSWGSAGTLRGYWSDEKAVESAVPQLAAFLKKAGGSGAKSIHILAHSMGNRAIAGVVRDFSTDPAFASLNIASITLAAPDIDAEIFKNEIAPKLASVSKNVALYVSEHDQSLKASRMLHQAESPRLGEGPIVIDGVQTIDVTSASATDSLGHSYYGSVPSLIKDIDKFWHGTAPASRSWLTQTSGYWVLGQ